MSSLNPGAPPAVSTPLSQALQRRKASPLPIILLALGLLIALGAAAWGYVESQRTEPVVVFLRDIPFGTRITAEDVGTISLERHRPQAVKGFPSPELVIGQYAARNLGMNDLVQPSMLMAEPPTQPVYPNGQQLAVNMVPVPFAVSSVGPVTDQDRLNIGFNDATGSPDLCDEAKTAAGSDEPSVILSSATQAQPRPYTCRLLSDVRVLWVDDANGIAYLEMTPYQGQTIRALQAASMVLWAERYGVASDVLPSLDRLDIGQVNNPELLAPAPTPMPTPEADESAAPADPNAAIPGANSPIPGSEQP